MCTLLSSTVLETTRCYLNPITVTQYALVIKARLTPFLCRECVSPYQFQNRQPRCDISRLDRVRSEVGQVALVDTVLTFATHSQIYNFRAITQEPIESSKQPIRTRYLDQVNGYQPIRDQYSLIRSLAGRS